MQDVGRAVGAVERVRDRRAVGVDLPGLPIRVVVAEGRRLAVRVGRRGQPTDRVVGVAPTPGSRQRHARPSVSAINYAEMETSTSAFGKYYSSLYNINDRANLSTLIPKIHFAKIDSKCIKHDLDLLSPNSFTFPYSRSMTKKQS